jgi:hypothetical protein
MSSLLPDEAETISRMKITLQKDNLKTNLKSFLECMRKFIHDDPQHLRRRARACGLFWMDHSGTSVLAIKSTVFYPILEKGKSSVNKQLVSDWPIVKGDQELERKISEALFPGNEWGTVEFRKWTFRRTPDQPVNDEQSDWALMYEYE